MTSLFAPSTSSSKALKRSVPDNADSEEAELGLVAKGGSKRPRSSEEEEAELPETFAETVTGGAKYLSIIHLYSHFLA